MLASLLARLTVTPPVGAGLGKVTANGADCPGATLTFTGRMIAPPDGTACTVRELDPNPGPDAVIVADPPATPVTCG
jgi:hypothetical protein